MNCPICNAVLPEEPRLIGRDFWYRIGQNYPVLECVRCGTGGTMPPVADEDLQTLYPVAYGPHEARPQAKWVRVVSRLVRVWQRWRAPRARYLRPLFAQQSGVLLDVGCGSGELAESFLQRGWQVSGIETSSGAASVGGTRGVDVQVGTPSRGERERNELDAVVLGAGLEHMKGWGLKLRGL